MSRNWAFEDGQKYQLDGDFLFIAKKYLKKYVSLRLTVERLVNACQPWVTIQHVVLVCVFLRVCQSPNFSKENLY